MKQEFVTLYGKAVIERNIVYFRFSDLPFSNTAFAVISYNLLWIFIFVMQFFREDGPKKYIGILGFGLLLLFRLPDIYDALLKRRYASRIPLDRIKSVNILGEYGSGLNLKVILKLKNGRYKKITFRTLEQQYQPFIDAVSQHITQPQPA